MTEQNQVTNPLESTETSAQCSKCDKTDQIQKMHYCVDCKVEICIRCAFKEHRHHNVIELAKEKAKAIAEKTDQVTAKQVDTYEKVLNHLQSELANQISELKSKFKESASSITQMEKYHECKQLGKDFEKIAKELVSSLRSCKKKIEKLHEKFNTRNPNK